MKPEEIKIMYDKQLEGVELSIISSKIHIFANLIQTALLFVIALKLLR